MTRTGNTDEKRGETEGRDGPSLEDVPGAVEALAVLEGSALVCVRIAQRIESGKAAELLGSLMTRILLECSPGVGREVLADFIERAERLAENVRREKEARPS